MASNEEISIVSPLARGTAARVTGERFRYWVITLLMMSAIVGAVCLDGWVVYQINRPTQSGQIKAILRALRCWGEGPTLVILALGIASVDRKRWRYPLGALLAALITAGAVDGAKSTVGRLRPSEANPSGPTFQTGGGRNSSFPSGHTSSAFAFARFLALAYPRTLPVALLAATGTALSRMVDQRHYLSDCVVGGMLGWIIASLLWYLPWKRWGFFFHRNHSGIGLSPGEWRSPIQGDAA